MPTRCMGVAQIKSWPGPSETGRLVRQTASLRGVQPVYTPREAQKEVQRRVREELIRRRDKDPDAYKRAVIAALRSELFDKQLAVMDDKSRRIALCCSRRAGKSELAARMIACALLQGNRNDYVLFAARTLQRAKQILLSILQRIDEQYALNWHFQPHVGQVTTPEGAVLVLLGVDDSEAVEKIRGSRYRLAICDEASTYEQHLDTLITDCLAPGTADFDPPGRILVCGTPGYVRKGTWFDIAEGSKAGYSRYHWILDENPHMKNIAKFLAEEREANGWTEDDPVYLREYRGIWSADASTLVYAYSSSRNDCRRLPEPPPDMSLDEWIRQDWHVTVAGDIGYTDDFAVCALGSPPHSKDIYVLYTYREPGLLAGVQADRIQEVRARFRPARTVIDAGGMGKLPFEEFNQRYGKQAGGMAIQAKKQGKIEAIGMLNSDLRTGTLKAWLPAALDVVDEWKSLPWADPEARDKEHKGFRNHTADCVLYCWREHRAYLANPAPKPKTPEQLEAERDERLNQRVRLAANRRR